MKKSVSARCQTGDEEVSDDDKQAEGARGRVEYGNANTPDPNTYVFQVSQQI